MNPTYPAFAAGAAALLLLALLPLLLSLLRPAAGIVAERRLAYALLLVLPLTTAALYALTGAPTLLQAQARGVDPGRHDVDAMVAALDARLRRNPDDAEGWYVLGRSYLDLEKYAEALAALAEARRQSPQNARMVAAYAEALAMSRGNELGGEAGDLIARALQLDPLEPKALELAGLAAYQAGDFALAVRHWRKLEPRLAVGSEQREEIAAAIRAAETLAATKDRPRAKRR